MKTATILAFAAGAIVVCTMFSACGSDQPSESNQVVVVSRNLGINQLGINQLGINQLGINQLGINQLGINQLGINQLGIEASHLSEMPNPKGEGTFVYVHRRDTRALSVT